MDEVHKASDSEFFNFLFFFKGGQYEPQVLKIIGNTRDEVGLFSARGTLIHSVTAVVGVVGCNMSNIRGNVGSLAYGILFTKLMKRGG
jgi:hypothetical protein